MTENTKTFLGLSALGAVLAWLMYDKDESESPKTIDAPHEVIPASEESGGEKPKQLSGIKEYRVVKSDDTFIESYPNKRQALINAKKFANNHNESIHVYWMKEGKTYGRVFKPNSNRVIHVFPKKPLSGKSKKKGKLSGKNFLVEKFDLSKAGTLNRLLGYNVTSFSKLYNGGTKETFGKKGNSMWTIKHSLDRDGKIRFIEIHTTYFKPTKQVNELNAFIDKKGSITQDEAIKFFKS